NGYSFSATSGVAFLSTTFSGSTATLFVPNTNLSNGSYSGVETINTIFGSVNVQVTLNIGVAGGGLVATPTQLFFSATAGGAVAPQNVSVSFNGSPISINGFNFTPTTGGVSF